MADEVKNAVDRAIDALLSKKDVVLTCGTSCNMPDKSKVEEVLKIVKDIIYPNFFSVTEHCCRKGYTKLFDSLSEKLYDVVYRAFSYEKERKGENIDQAEIKGLADNACVYFIDGLPGILEMTALDVKATLAGDPAASNPDVIILTYPGTEAIFTYRVAHLLYQTGVPFVPRIMSEYAHSKTGIDINPGAKIGKSFVIDHGTGVVIGETAVIGDRVKIYQGVTLGAKSLADARSLVGVKRHPTIEDNVTIYSGATILGGETVIGKGAVIGSSVFLTSSVPENVTVAIEKPKLRLYKNNPLD